jgi:hypothetical protein
MKSGITFTTLILFLGISSFNATVGWMNKTKGVSNEMIREAVKKSIPILQVSGNTFIDVSKFHCASCHHSSLTSMVVELAKQKGIQVEDSFAVKRINAGVGNLIFASNPNNVIDFLNVKLFLPYVLIGLYAEKYKPDFNTDIGVAFLISEAKPDGSFPGEYQRVPLEIGQIHTTALTIHAIQLYSAPALKPQVDQLVVSTRNWLGKSNASSQQELAYQLLGLQWCGGGDSIKKEVSAKLIKLQRPDGGWAQIPSMKSDAYATGQTLNALYVSGMVSTEDEIYQRALSYLLKTQETNGTWFVQARSYIIQPFFNSRFPPDDENQFISAAATNWATIALLQALPDKMN